MTIKGDYILFFGTDWPSNFAPSPISVWDDFQWDEKKTLWDRDNPTLPATITFKTAEAYYQSRKAVMAKDKDRYYKIVNASIPAETKKIAREIKLDPEQWDKERVKWMWETLKLKFGQNPDLKEKLLSEECLDKKFVEASPYDNFWGAGKRESSLIREIDVYGDIQWWDYKHDLPRATNMLGELLTKLRDEIE